MTRRGVLQGAKAGWCPLARENYFRIFRRLKSGIGGLSRRGEISRTCSQRYILLVLAASEQAKGSLT